MIEVIKDGISYVGMSSRDEISGKFFGSINSQDKINPQRGIIDNIVSIIGTIENINYILINTEKGIGNNGYKLLGRKIIIEVEYMIKLQYTTNSAGRAILVSYFKYLKVGELILPETFKEKSIEELERRKKIKVNAYIENLLGAIDLDTLTINANIILAADINL
ncbi:MAG: hypothetical protein ACRDAU_07215 [Clostridium sp.]